MLNAFASNEKQITGKLLFLLAMICSLQAIQKHTCSVASNSTHLLVIVCIEQRQRNKVLKCAVYDYTYTT